MKTPIILRRKDSLHPSQANYWKDLFYRVIKIGSELEVAPPRGCDRPSFETAVREGLHPSGSLEFLGEHGIWDVQPEHCGIEIRVIGRQPHFQTLHAQYSEVFKVLLDKGARPRSTCGLHFHMLTPGLAEPVPEIIMANIWNLTRRYAPELKFITSCGDSRESLCRHRSHNSYLEMIWHSPGVETMQEIQEALKKSRVVPEHQNFLNLEHLGFTDTGAILPFHLEFRFPDADICPTSVAAKTFLMFALTLKAVDLSQYGVIHVGKMDVWHRKIDLLHLISNNDGNLATSDTSKVTDEIITELRDGSFELLDLLSDLFHGGIDNPAFRILLSLANQPISLMRSAGHEWLEIEQILSGKINIEDQSFDTIDRQLMERIEFREWAGYFSQETWEWQAARDLEVSEEDLRNRLTHLQNFRAYRWDESIGAIVFIR